MACLALLAALLRYLQKRDTSLCHRILPQVLNLSNTRINGSLPAEFSALTRLHVSGPKLACPPATATCAAHALSHCTSALLLPPLAMLLLLLLFAPLPGAGPKQLQPERYPQPRAGPSVNAGGEVLAILLCSFT